MHFSVWLIQRNSMLFELFNTGARISVHEHFFALQVECPSFHHSHHLSLPASPSRTLAFSSDLRFNRPFLEWIIKEISRPYRTLLSLEFSSRCIFAFPWIPFHNLFPKADKASPWWANQFLGFTSWLWLGRSKDGEGDVGTREFIMLKGPFAGHSHIESNVICGLNT